MFAFLPVMVYSQSQCSYCNGTGRIEKMITVSHYGHQREAPVQCNVCGKSYLPSTGHTHVYCSYCGGTGKVSRSTTTSSSSSSREAVNIPNYTIPVSEKEHRLHSQLRATNQRSAELYWSWRSLCSLYREIWLRASDNRTMSVQQLDIEKKRIDKQLSDLARQFTVSDELKVIVDEIYSLYEGAYKSARARNQINDGLRRQMEQLDMQLLQWYTDIY